MAASRQKQALLMLTLATVAWGLSFPLTKTLLLAEEAAAPGRSSWLYAGLTLVFRFGLGGLFITLWRPKELARLTTAEWQQGLGLGLFGGLGILLQADGLRYTAASTSAFLTQFYCMLLPIVAVFRLRRFPTLIVCISTIAVLLGVGILARVDLRHFTVGRGELETLAASCLFTIQILLLELDRFRGNHFLRTSWVMFIVTALLLAAVVFPLAHSSADFLSPIANWPNATLTLTLAFVCSIFTYLTMNLWQPEIDATQAGLIYCSEPLFASLFALMLPNLLARFAAVSYDNETPGWNLVLGGSLITGANILMSLPVLLKRNPAV